MSLHLVWVVVGLLVGLSECMVIGLAGAVVPVASEVGLGSLLLLDFDDDSFDLKRRQFILKRKCNLLDCLAF